MKGRSTTLVYCTWFELTARPLSSKYSYISNCQGVLLLDWKHFVEYLEDWYQFTQLWVWDIGIDCVKELTKL